MRGSPETMEVMRPRTAREAVTVYGRDPEALPLAGGTDLMVLWNMGSLNNRRVLDLSGVKEWTRIVKVRGGLRIGSLATHAQIIDDPAVIKTFPLLAEACSEVGAVQVQNRGTLGGNIANASPAGDTFPPLAVYEAKVHLVSPRGRRVIPFLDVFAGVKKTTLGESELIEAVELPEPASAPSRRLFRKVGTRSTQAISKTVAAGLLWLEKGGEVRELRFALGSMAPTVRRLRRAEAALKGKRLSSEAVEAATALLKADVSPIDDVRSTAEYRLAASRNILRSFLEGSGRDQGRGCRLGLGSLWARSGR